MRTVQTAAGRQPYQIKRPASVPPGYAPSMRAPKKECCGSPVTVGIDLGVSRAPQANSGSLNISRAVFPRLTGSWRTLASYALSPSHLATTFSVTIHWITSFPREVRLILHLLRVKNSSGLGVASIQRVAGSE